MIFPVSLFLTIRRFSRGSFLSSLHTRENTRWRRKKRRGAGEEEEEDRGGARFCIATRAFLLTFLNYLH